MDSQLGLAKGNQSLVTLLQQDGYNCSPLGGFDWSMTNIRIPRALCAVIGEALKGSHTTLDALFLSSGAPGPPPNLAHHSKWKTWLFEAGTNPNVDSLAVLGNILEEFMDIAPSDETDAFVDWVEDREKVDSELEKCGLSYYRGGRVLPNGEAPSKNLNISSGTAKIDKPNSVEDLLLILLRGLRRAMHPLTHRRKGAQSLSFDSEYDIQDLLHSLLRPWVADIRPEEFTPSYAGTSTRMDFLLPTHTLVVEMKFVRDRTHGKKIGNELIIDIEHYRRHPGCGFLWCVIYDPNNYLQNTEGLIRDLEGSRNMPDGQVITRVLVL